MRGCEGKTPDELLEVIRQQSLALAEAQRLAEKSKEELELSKRTTRERLSHAIALSLHSQLFADATRSLPKTALVKHFLSIYDSIMRERGIEFIRCEAFAGDAYVVCVCECVCRVRCTALLLWWGSSCVHERSTRWIDGLNT